jgi:membrane-associated protein
MRRVPSNDPSPTGLSLDFLLPLVDFVLHLDTHLADLVARYGVLIYAILFAIIFCETGLVVTPFLPGDSLLFAAGALAAVGRMDPWILGAVLIVAAILGNTSNYWIGRYFGPRVFHWEDSRWFNRRALDRTHAFYDRHGPIALTMARFIPIVRTFAPFVAGIGAMKHSTFQVYSALGGVLWVATFLVLGYVFGNIPVVKSNLVFVMIGVIVISMLPLAWAAFARKRSGDVVR